MAQSPYTLENPQRLKARFFGTQSQNRDMRRGLVQKFKAGDKVKVSEQCYSKPHRGLVGVVDKVMLEGYGYIYVVRFDPKDNVLPFYGFVHEELELFVEP
jgi:hypothetical protein